MAKRANGEGTIVKRKDGRWQGVERRDVRPLDPEQVAKLIREFKKDEHRIGELITVAVTTGLRLGELLALEWSDLNLSEGVLSVRRTLEETSNGKSLKPPKSKAGRRAVSLGPLEIDAFRRRRDKAIAEGCHPDHIPVIFPNTEGRHLARGILYGNTWIPIRKAADCRTGSDSTICGTLRRL